MEEKKNCPRCGAVVSVLTDAKGEEVFCRHCGRREVWAVAESTARKQFPAGDTVYTHSVSGGYGNIHTESLGIPCDHPLPRYMKPETASAFLKQFRKQHPGESVKAAFVFVKQTKSCLQIAE